LTWWRIQSGCLVVNRASYRLKLAAFTRLMRELGEAVGAEEASGPHRHGLRVWFAGKGRNK
jgi:hypothetical protein